MSHPGIALTAQIGPECVFGQNVVVMEDVKLGVGVSLGTTQWYIRAQSLAMA
jgi:UDP-3-O-[3-hydroxymyristoyl] glucosamine N-acyltransferase